MVKGRKKSMNRLSSLSSGLISLDGFEKEVRQRSGEKIVLLVRMLGSK